MIGAFDDIADDLAMAEAEIQNLEGRLYKIATLCKQVVRDDDNNLDNDAPRLAESVLAIIEDEDEG